MPSSLPPATTIRPPGSDPFDAPRQCAASFWPRWRPASTSASVIAAALRRAAPPRSPPFPAPARRAGSPARDAGRPRNRPAAESPAPRRGTERVAPFGGTGNSVRFEGMEQRFQRFSGHVRISLMALNRKRARPCGAPVSIPVGKIRRRLLRRRPSFRGRVPCRSPGRRPSSTGGPCRARRSPAA